MPIFSTIAALGSAYLSKQSQNAANEQQQQQYGNALAVQQQQNAQNQAARSQALQQGYRGLRDIQQGYQQSLGSLSAYGVEAGRQVQDLYRQGTGAATAAGYNRGLSNTTAQAGLTAQATYNAQRAQGSVAERLAGLRSRLFADQAQATAGARGNIASLLQSNAAGGSQDAGNLAELYGSLRSTSAPVNLGAIGGLLDSYFGGSGASAGTSGSAFTGSTSSFTK